MLETAVFRIKHDIDIDDFISGPQKGLTAVLDAYRAYKNKSRPALQVTYLHS